MTRHPRNKKMYRKMLHPLTGTLVLAGAFACVSPVRAGAQAETGRVVGTVTDATGAAIPNAKVTITSTENGSIRTVTSNGSGELTVSALPAGNYSAKVEATGFGSQSALFTIVVTQSQTLTFKLSPGDVSTNVDVSTDVPLVNTSDATLGETIEEKQITELPLNGLNSLNLALLTPGVTQGAYGEQNQDVAGRHGGQGGSAISVNATRPQANNFILDGVDNNDSLQKRDPLLPSGFRHAGIQGGYERGARAVRSWRRSHRGELHQVGHEWLTRVRFRLLPQQQVGRKPQLRISV